MVIALGTSSAAIATSAGFTVSVAAAATAVEAMAGDPVVEMVVVNAVVTAGAVLDVNAVVTVAEMADA